MTLSSHLPFLHQEGIIESPEGFRIPIRILEIRSRYGIIDYRVAPLNQPEGARWVLASRVRVNPKED